MDRLNIKSLEGRPEEEVEQFKQFLGNFAQFCLMELDLHNADNFWVMGFVDDRDGQLYELVFRKQNGVSAEAVAGETRKDILELLNDMEIKDHLEDDNVVYVNAELYTKLNEKYNG